MRWFKRREEKKASRDIISCSAGVDPVLGTAAGKAVAAGRYRVYAAEPGGHAVLLTGGQPKLIVKVHRRQLSHPAGEQIDILSVEVAQGSGQDLHEQLDALWDPALSRR